MTDVPLDIDGAVFAHQTPVTRVLKTTEQLLKRAQERAPNPEAFDTHEPFFFRVEASNESLDSWFTHMMPSTLKNFAAEADRGVSFQNSHNHRALGFGRSLTGQYFGGSDGTLKRTEADIFTARGLQLNEVTTDDFISGVELGLLRDVSVGFTGGQFICNICGRDMLTDWGCTHWPGLKYAPEGKKRSEVSAEELILCTAAVEDGHLAEISQVYAGATPGAAVIKANRWVQAGKMDRHVLRAIETHYRVAIPGAQRVYAVVEEEQVPESTPPPEQVDLREVLGAPAGEEDPVRWAASELQRLRPLADEGRQYRADLVTQTLAEGRRAFGEEFSEEMYRDALSKLNIDSIKRMKEDWKNIGDKLFQGGRATVETDETANRPVVTEKRQSLPASAYRG